MSFASIPDSESADFGYRQLIGQRLGQKYVVEAYLAGGAYGYVFRGRDTTLDKVVAIKFGREGTRVKDLAGEARRVAQLDDLKENVVEVFDFGTHDSWPYLVMEFLPGVNLETVWEKQNHQLDQELIRDFVKQIGMALNGAHARGLVHRDLKPSNIQVISKGRDSHTGKDVYRFVLMDFGISSIIDNPSRTMQNPTLRQMGTPAYMSPEHILGNEEKGSESLTDVYAFGVILYQLLTGILPYPVVETQTFPAMLMQNLEAKEHRPPPFRKVAPDREIPSGVERLVRRCLEPMPQKRPQKMEGIVQEYLSAWPEAVPARQAEQTPSTSRRWLMLGLILVAATMAFRYLLPFQQLWLVSPDVIELAPEDDTGKAIKITVDGSRFRHADWTVNPSPGLEITPMEPPEVPLSWNVRVVDPNLTGEGSIEAIPNSTRLKSASKKIKIVIQPLLEFSKSEGVARLPFSSELQRFDSWQLPSVVTLEIAIPDQPPARVTLHLIVCTEAAIQASLRELEQGQIEGLKRIHYPQQSFYLSEHLVTWEVFHRYLAANPGDVEDYFWDPEEAKVLLAPQQAHREALSNTVRPYKDYVAGEAAQNPQGAATNLYAWMALKCCRWVAGPEATLPSAMEWDWVCGFTHRATPDERFAQAGPIRELKKTDREAADWEMVRTRDDEELADGIPSEKEIRELIWDYNADIDRGKRLKLRKREHDVWPTTYDDWDADNGGMSASTNIADDRVFRIAVPLEKMLGMMKSRAVSEQIPQQ